MKIAIIGSGVSGLVAAWLLHKKHDIVVFETNDYIGGHTHTIDVHRQHGDYAVDTGFIVFNEQTYPNFCKIIQQLGVESQPTEMSFSVCCRQTDLEYNPSSLSTLFAQKKNLLSPSFYRMVYEVFRFGNEFDRLLMLDHDETELVHYLQKKGYSNRFIDKFIVPIGSSLWSANPTQFKKFPLQTFVRFFKNHGFLNIKNPIQWRVIKGGSQRYVEKMTPSFADTLRLSLPIKNVSRQQDYIEVEHAAGKEQFDHVIFATHSDQALKLLSEPTDKEKEVLGAIPYQENKTVLHTDTSILPTRRNIWASWNYLVPEEKTSKATLTYDMNILQSIKAPEEFCVSLNLSQGLDHDRIIGAYDYQHPVYTPASAMAQKKHEAISGIDRIHFCGAYWGYGFHEDGVNSALAVCNYFGETL